MARYPAEPLEAKLTWMRQRQKEKDEEARRIREAKTQVAVEEPPPPPEPVTPQRRHRMMHVDEVARNLGMSTKTVRRWFKDRAVVVRAGRRRTTMLISEQILDDWIAEHIGQPKKRRGRG